ncbi:MAG: universal stress protein [Kofleriaceae bacterium]
MTAQTHVVVGYDFSQNARAALQRAVTHARAPRHVLHVLCVIDSRDPVPGIPAPGGVDHQYAARVQDVLVAEIQSELATSDDPTPVHFFVHARIGKPAPEILELAREIGADLIVLGNHGLTGLERLVIGSTSEKVVRDAGCSVEVVRVKQYRNVDLMDIVEVEPDREHPYIPPHRYVYEDHRVNLRPPEWPLY